MKPSEKIYHILLASVIKGYSDGIKKVLMLKKKYILKYSDTPDIFNINWTTTDEKLLNNFKKECFTVALIGEYELEEKLKSLAANIRYWLLQFRRCC